MSKIKIITFGSFPYGKASANYIRNFAYTLSIKFQVEVLLPRGAKYVKLSTNQISRFGQLGDIKYRYLGFINRPTKILGKIFETIIGHCCLYCHVFKLGLKKETDLIIKYQADLLSDFFLLIICYLFRIKYINILSEYYPRTKSIGFAWLHWQLSYLGIKYTTNFCDGNIVLSKFLRQFLINNGFSKPILLLPNIIDPDIFNIKSKPFTDNHLKIGYSGTPTKKDGIDITLESFAIVNQKHPNTHLLVMGDTIGKSSVPDLQNMARKLKVGDNVTFTGFISFLEIPALLNSCEILVLARPKGIQAEAGFPTKLGEYFACKKPVVLTAVGDMKEYFSNTDYVKLVAPDSPESFAEGINYLIENPSERQRIGELGYRWMVNNLSRNNLSSKINSFIHELLGK